MANTEAFNRAFSHRKAIVNGITLHYAIGGNGTPVVLLHGWLGTWYSWRKVMLPLAERHTIIVPDLRGYGDSSKPYTGYDGKTIVEDIRQLLAQLGIARSFVVGHDMGALPALLYAAEYPQEVLGLGYLDEPLPGYNLQKFTAFDPANPFVYWWFSFNSLERLPALMWSGKEAILLDYFFNAMIVDRRSIAPEDKAEYLRSLTSPGGLDGSFGWYRDIHQTSAQIVAATQQKLAVPVLALNGEYGHPGVREQMELVAENVAGGAIKSCGHLIAEEQPEALVDYLLEFFQANV